MADKDYQCIHCKAKFRHPSSHSRHQSGCGKSVESAHQCSQCYRWHLIKGSPRLEVDGFVCDICQKTFNKNWLLNRHKMIHKKRRSGISM